MASLLPLHSFYPFLPIWCVCWGGGTPGKKQRELFGRKRAPSRLLLALSNQVGVLMGQVQAWKLFPGGPFTTEASFHVTPSKQKPEPPLEGGPSTCSPGRAPPTPLPRRGGSQSPGHQRSGEEPVPGHTCHPKAARVTSRRTTCGFPAAAPTPGGKDFFLKVTVLLIRLGAPLPLTSSVRRLEV